MWNGEALLPGQVASGDTTGDCLLSLSFELTLANSSLIQSGSSQQSGYAKRLFYRQGISKAQKGKSYTLQEEDVKFKSRSVSCCYSRDGPHSFTLTNPEEI